MYAGVKVVSRICMDNTDKPLTDQFMLPVEGGSTPLECHYYVSVKLGEGTFMGMMHEVWKVWLC